MFFTSSTPIVRYTPPTCILEIYQKNLLNLSLNSGHNLDNIYFKLHFDDPRLPKEDKEEITGDRKLLVKLREEINNYISEFVNTKFIKINDHSETDKNEILVANLNKQDNSIKLIRQGLCQHKLYYLGEEKQIINLSNTQLFDIANSLENYYQESAQIAQKENHKFWRKLSLTLGFIGIFSLISGLWWWRNQQQIAQQANQSQQQTVEDDNDANLANLNQVIPPSPIENSEVPELLSPEETEEMKNRETLSPPPPTLTQPPVDANENLNIDNTALLNNPPPNTTNSVTPVNITQQEILPPPPSPPLPPPPQVTFTESENNVIPINSNPQPLPPPLSPPSPNISTIQPIPPTISKNQKPPRLNSLPVLQAKNSNVSGDNEKKTTNNANNSPNNPTDINSVAINAIPPNLTSPPQSNITKSSTPTNNIVTQDVKQYFQGKWQPPENLKQSIEYRLLINENGYLSRITPLGQSAQIFLDVTGMPLLGQTLSASAQESVTVRLILSPDGEVRTFQE